MRSVKLLRNKVRENLEILKKEQLNPEYFENNEKLEDWPSFELVTVEKTSTIIDFLVTDLNHDGIPDLILAVRHKDGTCSIKELIFSNTLTLQYSMQEIWFENTGIIELLGVYDLELSTYSILFLSGKGELSYMLNKDPVYSSEIMLKLGTTEKLSSFMSCDLNKDGKIDFLLVNNGELIWVYNEPTGWTSKTVYSDGVLQAILAKVTKNSISEVIVLYEDHVFWATEVPAKGSNEGFTWENNGETMVFHDFLIDLQETFQWSRFKIAVIFKLGLGKKICSRLAPFLSTRRYNLLGSEKACKLKRTWLES